MRIGLLLVDMSMVDFSPLLVVLISFLSIVCVIIFTRLRKLRKHKQLFGWQVDWAEEQWDVVEEQRKIIEHKQKQILDSINFAKKIQTNILQTPTDLKSILPESYIIFKPKDIVSGDFYWFNKHNETIILVVADCTGHGVPGGFLSMIGCTLLNEIVIHNKTTEINEIVFQLSKKLTQVFRKEEDSHSDVGMDLSIVKYEVLTNSIQYFSVNQPIYTIRENEVEKLVPQISSIDGIFSEEISSDLKISELVIDGPLQIVLSSDGYADQIGGSSNKKLRQKGLEEILLKSCGLNADESRNLIESSFDSWKANHFQIDDVLVVGFQV